MRRSSCHDEIVVYTGTVERASVTGDRVEAERCSGGHARVQDLVPVGRAPLNHIVVTEDHDADIGGINYVVRGDHRLIDVTRDSVGDPGPCSILRVISGVADHQIVRDRHGAEA